MRTRRYTITDDGGMQKNRSISDMSTDPATRQFNPLRPSKPESVKEAVQLQGGAAVRRAEGIASLEEGDEIGGRFDLAEAQAMEVAAAAYLDPSSHVARTPEPGNGGELLVVRQEELSDIPRIVDTVRKKPDMLNAEACRSRLELASGAGVLTMAVDAAQTIRARNSLERMLAHQLAAAHNLAMTAASRAQTLMRQHKFSGDQATSIEATRNANTAARLMDSFQGGLLVHDRMRRGGKQSVTVTHIHQQVAVGNGGKAVIAGSVRGARSKKKPRRGRGKK
jgi:hypothetical protein